MIRLDPTSSGGIRVRKGEKMGEAILAFPAKSMPYLHFMAVVSEQFEQISGMA
jgi:hypothetical protein